MDRKSYFVKMKKEKEDVAVKITIYQLNMILPV